MQKLILTITILFLTFNNAMAISKLKLDTQYLSNDLLPSGGFTPIRYTPRKRREYKEDPIDYNRFNNPLKVNPTGNGEEYSKEDIQNIINQNLLDKRLLDIVGMGDNTLSGQVNRANTSNAINARNNVLQNKLNQINAFEVSNPKLYEENKNEINARGSGATSPNAFGLMLQGFVNTRAARTKESNRMQYNSYIAKSFIKEFPSIYGDNKDEIDFIIKNGTAEEVRTLLDRLSKDE